VKGDEALYMRRMKMLAADLAETANEIRDAVQAEDWTKVCKLLAWLQSPLMSMRAIMRTQIKHD
jgi:hypothetical protein